MILFMGVDPGLETAVATVRWNGVAEKWDKFGTLTAPAGEACDAVWATFVAYAWTTHVGVERYTMSGRTGNMTRQNDAIEVIGALRWMSRRWVGKPLTFDVVGAAEATKIGNHEMQRSINAWVRGAPDHVRRAVAQLIYVISRRQPSLFADLINGAKIERT